MIPVAKIKLISKAAKELDIEEELLQVLCSLTKQEQSVLVKFLKKEIKELPTFLEDKLFIKTKHTESEKVYDPVRYIVSFHEKETTVDKIVEEAKKLKGLLLIQENYAFQFLLLDYSGPITDLTQIKGVVSVEMEQKVETQ